MKTYTVTEYENEDYETFRENVTNEEILNLLERIESGWLPNYSFDGTEGDFDNYKLHVSLDKAIDAMKALSSRQCNQCNSDNEIKIEDSNETITKEEYEDLLDRDRKLSALEAGGVDNWSFYEESLAEFYYKEE